MICGSLIRGAKNLRIKTRIHKDHGYYPDPRIFWSADTDLNPRIFLKYRIFPWSKSKNSVGFEVLMSKNPHVLKISQFWNFFENLNFLPTWSPKGKNSNFQKVLQIVWFFVLGGFSTWGTRIWRNFLILTTGRYLTILFRFRMTLKW